MQKNVKPAGKNQAYNSFFIAQLFPECTTSVKVAGVPSSLLSIQSDPLGTTPACQALKSPA
jgi:hypothetical protein